MKRYLSHYIQKDLNKKIILITGPRQVGKTTLAKSLLKQYDYLNYDVIEHRTIFQEKSWDRHQDLIIFDELHKMYEWKRWLKGIYDTEKMPPALLVTGSARIDTFKKVGDSLAGRYFHYRLHPLDIQEASSIYSIEESFDRLWHCGGFPEPFLKGDATYYNRWKRTHTDIILKEDLRDIQMVRDIRAIEDLVLILRKNVGSTISYANLARALEKDAKTIKNWLQLLENLYVIFKVRPYSPNINRSLLKEPKYYFYDLGAVPMENEGAKLENMVALSLLKNIHFLEDVYGIASHLYFLRTKDGKEIDFLVQKNEKPSHLIEVKKSDDNPSKHFKYFDRFFKNVKKIQLVQELKREKTYPTGLEIRSLIPWLAKINLGD